jgi:hypothetical protein
MLSLPYWFSSSRDFTYASFRPDGSVTNSIEINHDYEVEIKFRISVEQYMRIAA